MTRRYPILLEGPTSSGKTSLVEFLAAETGNSVVWINNNEQTDVQEYLGRYVHWADGRLVFQEGALVDAVRRGHLVILDEAKHLAPSEVLEALNWLVYFGRWLYVPRRRRPSARTWTSCPLRQNHASSYCGRRFLARVPKPLHRAGAEADGR